MNKLFEGLQLVGVQIKHDMYDKNKYEDKYFRSFVTREVQDDIKNMVVIRSGGNLQLRNMADIVSEKDLECVKPSRDKSFMTNIANVFAIRKADYVNPFYVNAGAGYIREFIYDFYNARSPDKIFISDEYSKIVDEIVKKPFDSKDKCDELEALINKDASPANVVSRNSSVNVTSTNGINSPVDMPLANVLREDDAANSTSMNVSCEGGYYEDSYDEKKTIENDSDDDTIVNSNNDYGSYYDDSYDTKKTIENDTIVNSNNEDDSMLSLSTYVDAELKQSNACSLVKTPDVLRNTAELLKTYIDDDDKNYGFKAIKYVHRSVEK